MQLFSLYASLRTSLLLSLHKSGKNPQKNVQRENKMKQGANKKMCTIRIM